MDAMMNLGREALLVALWVSLPPLVAALVAGTIAGVFQAATQIQEPTIGTVPRILAAVAALAVAAPWIGARVTHFASTCLELLPRAAR